MGSKLDIPGSTEFEGTGWQHVLFKTPRVTLNGYWRNGEPPLLFGFEGSPDRDIVRATIAALDSLNLGNPAKPELCLPMHLPPFEAVAFVQGDNRKFLRGLIEDESILHAFPIFNCERSDNGALPALNNFRRWTNILDPKRTAQPWFQFRMQGGQSRLCAQAWSTEKYSTFEGFVRVLAGESGSWLEVRNQRRTSIRLPDSIGWENAQERIDAHLGYRKK